MLVGRKSKNFNVPLTQNLKFDWKVIFPVVVFYPRMFFSVGKLFFLWMVNTGVELRFFKISRLKLQKLLISCWPSKAESSLRWVICWINSVRIASHSERHHWSMTKFPCKNKFHTYEAFSRRLERWTSCEAWILRSPVLTKMNLKNKSENGLTPSTL